MTGMAPWARRMKKERELRSWTQRDCVERLRYQTTRELPPLHTMLDQWKRWEGGRVLPSPEYQRMIASLFGSVSGAFFAAPRSPQEILATAAPDADTPDLLARLRRSAVDQATLESLRLTVDRLCTDYPVVNAHQLLTEGQAWLARLADLLDMRVSLAQHREILSMAGMLALLVGCLEQDIGCNPAAESTRRSALTLGTEANDTNIVGWAHEMTCWFALTRGDYRTVLTAAEAGIDAAGDQSVSVQLHAQAAKAWSWIGDRGRVEVALDKGRQLLEAIPPPTDPTHHFQVDPAKWDFYSMDVLRRVGEDKLADGLADEVLSKSQDWSGKVISPMRAAEALVTKGVVAARSGDLDAAIAHGRQALDGDRQSLPSLVMVGKELGEVLVTRYGDAPETQEYIEEMRTLAS
ncbi:XRE family transcriptional regulator [Nocardiopsis sp. EMB25]|uniref:XRE family transcriptional regulator n=1 Tax=Nocardiopsis sp. EMB25 TaxID=2835867 RepID=UPI0022851DE4|nr:XRE family transcriptional regulator [Nocardiopsis sp. EMB25]MCY9787955.1 XRE family transcriptional regulator [Nocardiopsis sp. EMB25]